MIQSFKVLATLAAYRIVAAVSGTANTVQYPEDTQRTPIGVTKDTVNDINEAIPVAGPGEIAKVYFNDTCVSGALVGYDTSGRGVQLDPAQTSTGLTLPKGVIGTLIGASVSETGTIADVYLNPQLVR